jgi:uncharacterized Zn finger protein (UPF0148 family)
MYCPRCGNTLSKLTDDTYFCEAGNMQLSPYLSKQFKAHFEEHSLRTPEQSILMAARKDRLTRWHCPNCGRKLEAKNGTVRCGRCKVNLTIYLHLLSKFSPHD